MTAAREENARALRGKAQARRAQPPAPVPVPPPPPEEDPNDKVRQTVDLTRAQHNALATWRMETGVALGRTRLSTQDVLAGLVSLVLSDETVARRARAEIAKMPEKTRQRRQS